MKIQRSPLRNNKGVSEIIASLILVLIVTSAGVVAYSYSIGAFSSSTSLFQLDTNQKERQAQERFAIIAVWSNTSSQLNLTVLNYGQIDLTIDTVYINSTSVAELLGWKEHNHRKRSTNSDKLHFTRHNPAWIYIRNNRCQHKRKQECDQLEGIDNTIGESVP